MSREHDELVHLLGQIAKQQQQENRFFEVGYIANYDPTRHWVQVLVPKYRDENTGECVVSPWVPLGTFWVGSGFGLQIAPKGGATSANPSAGEQCILEIIERDIGIAACAHLYFSNAMQPPLATIAGGEAIAQHESGSYLYFKNDGSLNLKAAQNLTATVAGNMIATVTGTASIAAAAVKLCRALTDTLYTLCTSIFESWAASHTHSGVQTGTSNSGPPTTAPPANSLTSTVTAE